MRDDVGENADIRTAKAIFEAFVANDRGADDSRIAQNFSFTGSLDNALDRDAYFAICWPNSETMKRVDFCDISKCGNRVFVTYEAGLPSGKRIRNTEVLTVNMSKISAVEVYFGWNVPHEVAVGDHRNP